MFSPAIRNAIRPLGAAAIALSLLASGPVSAGVVRVPPGGSIQAAIDGAAAGDTIEIERGHYRENLRIERALTLRGINRPTIDGGLSGDTIRVSAGNVRIEGLIVIDSGASLREQNAGIYLAPGAHHASVVDCILAYNLFGLWIEKADDVLIEGNVIVGKRDLQSSQRGNGIQLYNTLRARIIGNRIGFVRDALYVDVSHDAVFRGNHLHNSRYGTHYMNSYRNLWEDNEVYRNRGGLALMEVRDQVVRNNRVWGNSDHGIMLRTIQDSLIENNIVAGNGRGFFMYDAYFNRLQGNLVIANLVGLHVWAGSKDNPINGNDFIGNREQVRYVAARDQEWGLESANHWSNYLGWDRDGDGLGDVAYEANDMVDRLSWRHPTVKLLLASPALQTLRLASQQFPLLRAPSIVEQNPRMRPSRQEWREWRDKSYPGAR